MLTADVATHVLMAALVVVVALAPDDVMAFTCLHCTQIDVAVGLDLGAATTGIDDLGGYQVHITPGTSQQHRVGTADI
ncbi:hypothetical protein LH51_03670 [Nitrincola sp. A-D6]|nr:hypothetical protein LH51_03670 [Nitrincola sp. A-D6]